MFINKTRKINIFINKTKRYSHSMTFLIINKIRYILIEQEFQIFSYLEIIQVSKNYH